MRYRFDGCRLDVAARELRRDDTVIDLDPRTFSVLHLLIRHRDRIVTKDELLDGVWGDRFVTESAVTTQIKYARHAVGDDGRSQRIIKTVYGTGYRFVAAVEAEDGDDGSTSVGTTGRTSSLGSPTLFGRDGAIERIERALRTSRLVSIVGPGGIGKTAVARQLLRGSSERSGSTVGFCELASTRDPTSVASVVLGAVGDSEHGHADPIESAVRALEGRQLLLVLDNCEHVLSSVAPLTSAVVQRCPGVRFLATSTVPLGVHAEAVYPLEPLGLDDACACFVARATSAGATIDPADPAVLELCRRLDGVPLAIELAAARARTLSPSEMLTFVDDRFRLLRVTTVGGDHRHQSLYDTIAWSWDALADDDRRLLSVLGTFVGPFLLDDARSVAGGDGDALDSATAVARLADSSLVIPSPGPGGRTAFRLLESIREFAFERTVDPDAVRRAHTRHYADLAERLDAACQTDDVDEAMNEIEFAWDNFRGAARYASDDDDLSTLRRIVAAVGGYAELLQLFEVIDWCDHPDFEQWPEVDSELPVAADALAVKAVLLAHRGEHERGRALAARAHDAHTSYRTTLSRLVVAYLVGDVATLVSSIDVVVELSRSARGLDRAFADSLAALLEAVRVPSGETNTTLLEPADAALGLLPLTDCLVAGLRLSASDPTRATALLDAVVQVGMSREFRLQTAVASSSLTHLVLPNRSPDDAMRILRGTLSRYRERSMWRLICADIVMAATLLAAHGEVETAARLVGARLASNYSGGFSEQARVRLQAKLEEQLGDRFAELADEGATWRPLQAADRAIAALDRALAPLGPST